MSKISKANKLSLFINILIILISTYSFLAVTINYNIFLAMGVLTLIAIVVNVVTLISNKRNEQSITGDVLALIGLGIYLLIGPFVGLICAIFVMFSIIFKIKYSQ